MKYLLAISILLFAASLAIAAPPDQTADTTPPDDAPELMLFKEMPIVVAAGKREKTQQQVAASVSVVDANQISLYGYRSLADILRNQRSFYLTTDGLNWFAGVRGFERPGEWNARLMVLVDGRPTRELIYGQTHLDQDFVLPVEAMKRVEIIRGPGSSLYGSNAVFGVVNVVSKDGADVNGVEVKGQGGTQETGRSNVLFGKKFDNGWDVVGDFAAYTSKGDRDILYDDVHDAAHNFGRVHNGDYEGADAGFLKVRKGDFTAQFDMESRQKGNRSATYLASFTEPGNMHEDRANVTLRIDHEISEGKSIHAMAYYGHYNYNQSWGFDSAGSLDRYTSQGTDDWLGQEIHYDWQVNKPLHLTLGADATQSLFTTQRDHDSESGPLFDQSPSFNSWAVFAEAEYKLTEHLTLVGGLRVDTPQRIGTLLSPRFGAIYSPNTQDTYKALYGRAFRQPNLYEMFYTIPDQNTGNPNLRSEIVDTYEGVWEHRYNTGWRSSLDVYLWKMSDAMENQILPSGALQTQNSGTLWAHGIELEFQKEWEGGAMFRGYATYSRADHDGATLTHSPTWIVGTATVLPVFNRNNTIAIEPQIISGMKSDLGDYTSPTFITNIVFTSRELRKGLDFQLGFYNLFGNYARLPRDNAATHFQPTLNYPEPRILASLTCKF